MPLTSCVKFGICLILSTVQLPLMTGGEEEGRRSEVAVGIREVLSHLFDEYLWNTHSTPGHDLALGGLW